MHFQKNGRRLNIGCLVFWLMSWWKRAATTGILRWYWLKRKGDSGDSAWTIIISTLTVKDSHSLPLVDGSLDALTSSWFNTLDLFGYRQVEGAEENREKTALMTGRVFYQCTAMLMSLTHSPPSNKRWSSSSGAHHGTFALCIWIMY